jgi:hypothetical protein
MTTGNESQDRRRRGRPPLSQDGTKLVSVPIWMTPNMREALREAAAADGGRSMSSLARRILVRAVELEAYL